MNVYIFLINLESKISKFKDKFYKN